MRVVIDLDGSDGRWRGTFAGDGGQPVSFDGRLQLLRMLEEVVDALATTNDTDTGMETP